MTQCGHCPIAGPCLGEWRSFACEFGRDDANPIRRRYLEQESADLDGGEPPPPSPNAPPTAYPSLAKQAANLAGSVGRFVGSGFATVDQSEFDRRREICRACPTGRYDAVADRCRVCGCNVSVKPWGKVEACPDGHW